MQEVPTSPSFFANFCCDLGKSLQLLEPQFLHIQNGEFWPHGLCIPGLLPALAVTLPWYTDLTPHLGGQKASRATGRPLGVGSKTGFGLKRPVA